MSKYNQLDLMGGLFKEERRELAFVDEGLSLIESMKYIKLQVSSSEVDCGPKLSEILDYLLYTVARGIFLGSRHHPKYKLVDEDWFMEKTALPDVNSTQVVSEDEVKEYFWRLEHKLRVWVLAYKDMWGKIPNDSPRLIKLYVKEANNLLHNEI